MTWKLFPAIVTLHLLGGLALLALLCVQAARHAQAAGQPLVLLPVATRRLLAVVFALLTLQTALGGWVSANYAVLACNEFPTCQGGWWPDMDLRQGFTLWRELGLSATGEHISFAALTGIHYMHRLMAYAVLAALALLVWRLRRLGLLRAQARWMAMLALWQFATGLSNVVLDWPLAAAVSHTGGAAALVAVLTWSLAASRAAPQVARLILPNVLERSA